MKKKALSLILLLTMVTLVFAGCSKQTSADILNEAIATSSAMNSYEYNADFAMLMETGTEEAYGPQEMSMQMSGKNSMEPLKGSFDVTMDVGMGFILSMDGYYDETEMLFSYPLFEGMYIRMPMSEMTGGMPMGDIAAYQDINKDFIAFLEAEGTDYATLLNLQDELVETKIDINGTSEDVYELKMLLGQEEIKNITNVYFKFIMNDENGKQLMLDSMNANSEITGITYTAEELETLYQDMQIEMDAAFADLDLNAEMIAYVNKSNQLVKMDLNLTTAFDDGFDVYNVTVGGFMEFFNIDQPVEVTKPDITEDMIINFDEMM